jgi:hypothetical protein
MRFPSKSIVSFRLARKLAVIGRWPLCRSGDGFSPHTVLKLGTAFARCCELIGKLRLAMRLNARWYVFPKQLHNIASVRFGQQLRSCAD